MHAARTQFRNFCYTVFIQRFSLPLYSSVSVMVLPHIYLEPILQGSRYSTSLFQLKVGKFQNIGRRWRKCFGKKDITEHTSNVTVRWSVSNRSEQPYSYWASHVDRTTGSLNSLRPVCQQSWRLESSHSSLHRPHRQTFSRLKNYTVIYSLKLCLFSYYLFFALATPRRPSQLLLSFFCCRLWHWQ